jgi:cell division protein FtsI (penicillin-binding protein 3)
MRLGAAKLHRWFSAFGLGRKTGIDLPGEVGGLFRPVAQWSGLSLASHAIGQELAITPIQLVTAYAAIANGGWLVQPHLVEAVIQPDGASQPVARPSRRRVISGRTAGLLRDMLVSVTEPEGTGARAVVPGFRVAGKTGTAQKINPDTRRYDSQAFVSSFIGFVPAEAPKFVLLVIVDGPKGAGWGGTVAAPVFRQIAGGTLHYLGVVPKPSPPTILAQAPTPRPGRSAGARGAAVAVALPAGKPSVPMGAVVRVE